MPRPLRPLVPGGIYHLVSWCSPCSVVASKRDQENFAAFVRVAE